MGLADKLKQKLQTFMQRPGATVSLAPSEALLPRIEALEEELGALSDEELTERAGALRERLTKAADVHRSGAGTDMEAYTDATSRRQAVLIDDDDLVEICALGREAGRRALDERAFDVQLLGAMAMLAGTIVEMATGEGKTLAAAIAAYGYVARGSRVQILTVNDYLARRDAEWMGPVYGLLGLSVGSVGEDSTHDERLEAYARDVCYVSVSEVGFDFLRDQLVLDAGDEVMPGLPTLILDEADSVLIDEARVPLVLAGSFDDSVSPAASAATLVAAMQPGRDFEGIEDGRNVQLTEAGALMVEKAYGGIDLYAPENLEKLTAVNLALHARALLTLDVDYIVRDGKVQLVDGFRGRIAQRRRWPDGLQAAVEAKEGLTPTAEGEVLATITVQGFIGLYPTVCGMTGTAVNIGDELREFYRLEVAVIPPNTPSIRIDEADRVYVTAEEKEDAIIAEVAAAHEVGRPVLIGTLDVAESERLAAALRAKDIECVVLNAKNDASEAKIIAEAGGLGRVTVSTQMAGRGTDIRLGGRGETDRDAVVDLGGLLVIGSGRHNSRRVDDQLRGRAGRQGDPGGSVFFVSPEDTLIVRNGEPFDGRTAGDGRMTGPAVDRAVSHAQKVSEGVAFEIHRNTWRYGVLIERQRQQLAFRRLEILAGDLAAQWVRDADKERYDEVVELLGEERTEEAARLIGLAHLDRGWADHLAMLADVREGVHLRALGRQDPLDEFHRVAIPAFKEFLDDTQTKTVETFAEADLSEGWTPDDEGLVRPSTTWTYMVHENPFGSEIERFISAAARAVFGVSSNPPS
ncbi:accessory Sec system translocase SecA2 [Hamadaea tsunoensis]|uniref:accessory Sec system translocase SecA2 n=1 Tax=Hamadaea tsunoensis TaxID=53368 RepID=UPI000487C211|nr:accessory Sec system translocase SecA2 [Hamadaea tsunoensis]